MKNQKSMRSNYITRKEIAAANEVSDDTIARNEKRYGLDTCRDRACRKPVRYRAVEARARLREQGLREPE